MVNNSTYINKTNDQLSPRFIEHIGSPDPGFGQAQKMCLVD